MKGEIKDTQKEMGTITGNKVEIKTTAMYIGETLVQRDEKLSQIMFLGAFPL